MKPKVSIIMGSTSDLGVMEKASKLLEDFEIPFEMKTTTDRLPLPSSFNRQRLIYSTPFL